MLRGFLSLFVSFSYRLFVDFFSEISTSLPSVDGMKSDTSNLLYFLQVVFENILNGFDDLRKKLEYSNKKSMA